MVINKGLRLRIYGLGSVVLVALPLQVVSLAFTVLWNPEDDFYGVVSLLVFLGAFCCAVTGEGILVIKPISDALDAGGSCCRWTPRHDESPLQQGRKMDDDEEEEEEEEERVAFGDLEGGKL